MLCHWATTACIANVRAGCFFSHFIYLKSPSPGNLSIYLLQPTNLNLNERETRLELATYSLEGYRSTKWATPAYDLKFQISNLRLIRGQGWIRTTELRRGQIYSLLPLATWLLAQKFSVRHSWNRNEAPEPVEGFEPPTSWLQISCSGQLSYTGIFVETQYYKELLPQKT